MSIIVCTRDRAESLVRTLAGMRSLAVPGGWHAELIVVDNGSRDNTQAAARQAWQRGDLPLRVLCEPRGGKSAALNCALRAAGGDVMLFTDDDVVPPEDWIGPMCRPVLEGHADAVAGGIRLGAEFDLPWLSKAQRLWLAHTEGVAPGTPIPLIGANMAIGRAVFETLGGFDELAGPGATGHAEDILYWLRVRDAGYRIVPLVEVQVVHHPGVDRLTWGHYAKQARRRGEFAAYVEHHYEGVARRRVRLGLCKAWLKLWAMRLAHLPAWSGARHMHAWEMECLEAFHARRHLLVEQRFPRRYAGKGSTTAVAADAAPRVMQREQVGA